MTWFFCVVLTEEKGVDLGQKKDSYFDNCCRNWPTAGKNCCIIMSILEWLETFIYQLEYQPDHPARLCFSFFPVHYVRIRLYEDYSYITWFFYFCVRAVNTLPCREHFWTWECWLKQISTMHGNPFYQKHNESFREIWLCHCQFEGACFTNNALSDLSPFII